MQANFSIPDMSASTARPAPGLYLVATPIGNLGDITLRALATLGSADLILAEDKRVTRVLLNHYGIRTPLLAYHEHNAEGMRPQVMARLAAGEVVAIVSDAGTPLVSDPGFRLVEGAIAADLPVFALPGASSLLAGLLVSGLPSDRFFFEGFLPAKSGERRRRIRDLAEIPATLIFFEAPHRVCEALADLAAVLGARAGVLARELTKKFEEVRRARLPDLAAQCAASGPPKGEIVLLVGPPGPQAELGDAAIDAALALALERHSQRDAVQLVAAELGLARRRVYARALLGGGRDPDLDKAPGAREEAEDGPR